MSPKLDIEQIARTCGKASRSGDGWNCRCPVPSHGKGNGDKNPSLSLAKKDGKLLAHCYSGCTFESIVNSLKHRGLLSDIHSDYNPVRQRNRQSNSTCDRTKIKNNKLEAFSIWNNASDAKNTLVEKYFHFRGLTITPPETIRFHENLRYSEQNNLGVWHESHHPAMVSKIQIYPDDECFGIHRTYLQPDGFGKAKISKPKKMLGTCLGGAVRFDGESLECIAVGEGIESCLSYLQFNPMLTVWACLSSGGLERVLLPPLEITPEIIIIVDHDLPGMSAATKLAERLVEEGRKVFPVMPSTDGFDMNDLLVGEVA